MSDDVPQREIDWTGERDGTRDAVGRPRLSGAARGGGQADRVARGGAAQAASQVAAQVAAQEAAVDAGLVRRARDGDREAFGQLVRRHLATAHSAALAVAADQADAEDVVQDAFLTALTRLEECRPEEKFRAWLLVIVRNRAIDLKRRQRVRMAEPLDADTMSGGGSKGGGAERDGGAIAPTALASRIPGPFEEAERADTRRRLEAALATLTDVRREVVLLHDLEGWSHREIAAQMGIAEGTVRAHLFWARRALRERLRVGSRESEHGT